MKRIPILLLLLLIFSCKETNTESKTTDSPSATKNKDETIKKTSKDSLIFPEEKHFKSLQQVTLRTKRSSLRIDPIVPRSVLVATCWYFVFVVYTRFESILGLF